MRGRSRGQRIATLLLVALIAATLLRAWDRFRAPPSEPTIMQRPDLDQWEMTGCYDLAVEPWEFSVSAQSGFRTPETPTFLVPPTRVRLLPDSTDRWRRSLTTYRAVPMAGDHDPRLADYLRWVVRADTLWLLWSNGRAGGGIALRRSGDSLLGRARAFDRQRGLDGDALAAAWRLNCGTLERDLGRRLPRR
jgi:hypothetical protein